MQFLVTSSNKFSDSTVKFPVGQHVHEESSWSPSIILGSDADPISIITFQFDSRNSNPYVFRNNLRPQNFTRFDDENQNTIAEIEAISLGRDQNAMAGTKMPRPNK